MLNSIVLLKRFKTLVTPFLIVTLAAFSWEHLVSLFAIPVASLLLMLLLGGLSLWGNSLIIRRVTSRYQKYVSTGHSLWMTSVGVLGNSLGLPIGTGIKYYFWVQKVGLKVRQSVMGVGYFSLFSFLFSTLVALALFSEREGVSELWLVTSMVLILGAILVWAVSRLLFKGSVFDVLLDFGLVIAVVLFMVALFSLPLAFYYPSIDLSDVMIVSFGFIALSYLTFISSFPAGQELLLGVVTVFFSDDFMLGVAVGLAVRMIYVINAGMVVLLLKPFVGKAGRYWDN